jgi:ribosomal protein S18 acetylase RimI-like enzyme
VPVVPCSGKLMDQAEVLVRSVFPSMSPIERFSFIAIRRPQTFTNRLLMCFAGVKDLVSFDVYVDENALVLGTTGLYRYKKDFDEAVWLSWFCVDPNARGRGVGQALLEHSVARARETGFSLMRLYTSTDPNEASAQRLYERNGFMEVGRKKGLRSTTVFREKKLDQV